MSTGVVVALAQCPNERNRLRCEVVDVAHEAAPGSLEAGMIRAVPRQATPNLPKAQAQSERISLLISASTPANFL
jgi:hypothetical protein